MLDRWRNAIQFSIATVMWLTAWYVIATGMLDARPLFDPVTITFVSLAFAAPALTFIPLAQWAGAPFVEWEAIGGWGTLLLVLAFVTPASPPTLPQFLLLVVSLTVALAVVFSIIFYWLAQRPRGFTLEPGYLPFRRRGYLLSLAMVAGMLLYSAKTLTPVSLLLLLVVAGLLEGLASMRDASAAA